MQANLNCLFKAVNNNSYVFNFRSMNRDKAVRLSFHLPTKCVRVCVSVCLR